MNKAELINAIAAESGLTKTDSKKALDGFIVSVIRALRLGERVALVGFGTFSVGERSERRGVNPATKEIVILPRKRVVKFRVGTELAAAVE